MDVFQYKPLEAGQIRLIQLEPGVEHDPLLCRLIPYSIEDQWISYTALSYCWGDLTLLEVLYCPEALPITTSLHSALRRLRHKSLTILVWADAACIDQTDDHEKNEQVLFMQRIYQQAGRVAIYLGEEAEDSQLVPLLIRAESGRASQVEDLAEQDSFLLMDRAKRAFEILLRRPWFTRVWVIQEVALAAAPDVLCGSWVIPFREIANRIKRGADTDIDQHQKDIELAKVPSIGGRQCLLMDKLHRQFNSEKEGDLTDDRRPFKKEKRRSLVTAVACNWFYSHVCSRPPLWRTWTCFAFRASFPEA